MQDESTPLRSLSPTAERLAHAAGAAAAWVMLRPFRIPTLVPPEALGLPVRRFRLPGAGVELAAWHIPCPGSRSGIVLCHGHNDSRAQFHRLLRPLHQAGFHLLLFDQRSMGASPGLCTYGFAEQWDAVAAARWLREEAELERIGIFGVSMGGSTALLAAARDPEIAAVATDCAFARLEEMVERKLLILPPAARGPIARATREHAERWTGADAAQVDPEEALRRWSPRPLLVIQAAGDLLVPPEHGERLASAAGPGAELWMVPGAWHARSHAAAGPAYVERLTAFFRRHLGTAGSEFRVASGTGGVL